MLLHVNKARKVDHGSNGLEMERNGTIHRDTYDRYFVEIEFVESDFPSWILIRFNLP